MDRNNYSALERFDKWHGAYVVSTYAEAKEFFSKAKNPVKGKPLQSWAVLKQDGDDYVVHMKHWNRSTVEVGRFKPDNTFVFTLSNGDMRKYSITLSRALHRALPYQWVRVATGRYQVTPMKEVRKYIHDDADVNEYWSYLHEGLREECVEIHSGIAFNLDTNKAINPKPQLTDRVNKDNRKVWMRAVKEFRKGLKLKARMGVVATIMEEVRQERASMKNGSYFRPDWISDEGVKLLYNAVKNNDTSIKMIKYIVMSASYGYYRAPSVEDVLKEFENIINANRLELRRMFGVFEE